VGRGRAKAKQAPPVQVPDLRGLTVAEAEAVAAGAGLVVVGPDGRATGLLRGLVAGQRPEPGPAPAPFREVVVWTSGPGGEAGVREPVVPPPLRRGGAAPASSEPGQCR